MTCLIYLCYKTNQELGTEYKAAEYMILDYFYGITKINNYCVPINKRYILLSLLKQKDSNDFRIMEITDPEEIIFNKLVMEPFKLIKQYTFHEPIKYTDCGETTILNLFNYLLLNKDGTFNLTKTSSWDLKLKEFYTKYPTMNHIINTNIEILKTDLAIVFNNRNNQIRYNRDQYDIHTSIDNIIDKCAILLGIHTNDIKDIFIELNSNVREEDIKIDTNNNKGITFTKVTYDNHFILNLNVGHGEFIPILKLEDIHNIEYNLNNHWISLQQHHMASKYSFEHFKYIFHNALNYNFFAEYFPVANQTEEICIEAVHPSRIIKDKYYTDLIVSENFRAVRNKTYKICKAAVSFDPDNIKTVPKELLNKELCDIALEGSLSTIKYIPIQFIGQDIIQKIKSFPYYPTCHLVNNYKDEII